MAVFHQMGHHSNNLIDLPQMSSYAGAIFSPINCTEADATGQIAEVRKSKREFRIIFDPQLYVPAAARGKLKKWSYFPKDVDTADLFAKAWWADVNKKIASACLRTKVDAVCSPLVIPRVFDDKYYSNSVRIGTELLQLLKKHGVHVYQTALINLAQLTTEERVLQLASIISGTEAESIYLIFVGDTPPRREVSSADELKGAMQLIGAFERNDLPVLVGFCSSDVILWKAAGASDCASGKFFNLRRFTRQRFEEPSAGGQQFPYWFEEGLLAFLRQGDLLRIRKQGLLSEASLKNPFTSEIFSQFDQAREKGASLPSWLALGWRQFLYWFADIEKRLSQNQASAEDLMTLADANWKALDAKKVLMEERFNDGTWIRVWLNAVRDFRESSGGEPSSTTT
jgi:hypothetical protein